MGDERGFVALVSRQTGVVEAVHDGRLSMTIREFSDINFSASSEPTTLRYYPADLDIGMQLLGRHDLLELVALTAKKTIEVSQGKVLGGIIRIKFSEVSSPFQCGIDYSAEPTAAGRWLLETGTDSSFNVDCNAFYSDTGEPLTETLKEPLSFLIDRPSHVILRIEPKKLLEDTCILTDNWQMAAVLSSWFHDPSKYLPVLPVSSVPLFFRKRQHTNIRQVLYYQQPTRVILADLPQEIEDEILWGIPNLGTVERYRNLQDVYKLFSLDDSIVCPPSEMANGLLIAKRTGKHLVLEEGHQLSVSPKDLSSSRDIILVEGSSLASVVAVNYAYFRGAQLIDVGKIESHRLAWFDQKCGNVDCLTYRIRGLYDELSRRGKAKVKKGSIFSSTPELSSPMPEQSLLTKMQTGQVQSLTRDLTKMQKHHIQEIRDAMRQVVGSIDTEWDSMTAFTEGVPYTVGVDMPCGLVPNEIAAHYIFDEVHGETLRMSPTASLLVVDPGFFGSNSEAPLVVTQFLTKRASSKTVFGEEATKDNLHSYLKFFPYDFLLFVTHGDRTDGSISLYKEESLSQTDLIYLTEMNNLKRPLVFNNACSSWYAVGRNFLWFGARAYIGTLWSVRTSTAADMAKHFSQNLFRLPMAESLFKAKKSVAKTDFLSSKAYIFIGSAKARFQALESTVSELQKAIELLTEYDSMRVEASQLTPLQELVQHQIPKRLDYIFQLLADDVLSKTPLLQPYIDFLHAHWLSQLVDAEVPHPYRSPREILEKAITVNRGNLKTLEKEARLSKSDKDIIRQILRRYMPMSLVNLGIEYRREGKKEVAINCFSEALQLFEELGDYVGMGDCLANWGSTLGKNQRDEIRERLQTAKSYYLRAGNQRKAAAAELTMGGLARDEHMWQEAKAHYLTAKQILSALGDYQGEAEATILASEMYAISGEIDIALDAANEMVTFCDRRGLIELSCRARLLQAGCFFERDQPGSGISCIIDALNQSRRLPGPKVFNRVIKGFLQAVIVAVRKGYPEDVVAACRRVKSDWSANEQVRLIMTAIELACTGRPSEARDAIAYLGEPVTTYINRLIDSL